MNEYNYRKEKYNNIISNFTDFNNILDISISYIDEDIKNTYNMSDIKFIIKINNKSYKLIKYNNNYNFTDINKELRMI